jgi:DNA-binding SARP family transcriptional activator/TolB-like protein
MIELTTFGPGTIRKEGAELAGLAAQRQKYALLVYLALEGRARRDKLLALFWPDRDSDKARHSLSQTLYSLRHELQAECVRMVGDTVEASSNVCVIDAAQLQEAAQNEAWHQVVEMYNGPFLDGFYLTDAPEFNEWVIHTRNNLAQIARRGFREVISAQQLSDNTPMALATAWHWASVEPLEDEAQHTLIALLAETGNLNAALDRYDVYRMRLAHELQLEPLKETVDLAERIRIDARSTEVAEPDKTPADQKYETRVSIKNLRWRRLVKVGLVYAGFSWLVMQVTATLIEREVIPPQTFTVFLYVLAVGLPITLVTAWARERRAGAKADGAWWRRLGPGGITAVVVATALFAFLSYKLLNPFPGDDGVITKGARAYAATSIAVFDFDDYSEDGRLEHVANSLTEYVITALDRIPALNVRPRNAVRPLRESLLKLDSVAELLEVGTLVEGSVSGSQERALITVQVIDAADLSHSLTNTIEASATDPLDLVQTVSDTIANLLREHLALEIETESGLAGTESEEAWDRFVQARRFIDDAIAVAASNDTVSLKVYLDLADRRFAEAEANDQRWNDPIVQRGWVAALRARYLAAPGRNYDPAWTREGLLHADRALELELNSAAAWELRGTLLDYLADEAADRVEWDSLHAEAEATLRRALSIDESRAKAWSRLSRVLEEQTRYAEAKEAAENAYAADAFQEDWETILSRLCWTSVQSKQFDDVTRWCREGRRRYPESAHYAALWLAALAGPEGPEPDVEQTWELAATIQRLMPNDERELGEPRLQMQVAAVLARAGLEDSARSVLRRGRELATLDGPELDYQEANVRLQLGERDAALQLLESLLASVPDDRESIAKDWWFESLRDDPRFQALVATPR